MNILVVGDSWGCYFADTQPNAQWSAKNDKLSWLQFEGHLIFNCAIFGGTNLQTLNEGKTFLQERIKYKEVDLIIWFYTELGREELLPVHLPNYCISRFGTESVLDTLDRLHTETNKTVSEIRNMCPDAKWAIIGGHASLYRPDDYDWAEFVIEDLLSEIVGYQVPTSHFQNFDFYNNPYKTKNLDILTSEMSKYENILSVKKSHPDIFWDGVHPNTAIINEFAIDKILNHFSKKT